MGEHSPEHGSGLPVGADQGQVHLVLTPLEVDIIARALHALVGNIDLTRRIIAARQRADRR
jgi:hypothetical protein